MSPRRHWDSPTPSLSLASVPLPPGPRGEAHSPAGEGLGESQFRRLQKKLSTLPTLCSSSTSFPPHLVVPCSRNILECPAHKVLTYIEYRAVSGVFRINDPPPPLPRTKGGGVHTRRAVRGNGGGGVNISEDARHLIGLLHYNPSTVLPFVLRGNQSKEPRFFAVLFFGSTLHFPSSGLALP